MEIYVRGFSIMKGKVLITGSSGFLGSHLIDRLKSMGYFTIGMDIKYPEYNKPDLFINKSVKRVDKDIVKGLDWIFHTADYPVPLEYMTYPMRVLNGINDSMKLFELAYRFNVKLFIFSTSELYGNSDWMSEDNSCEFVPFSIRNAYAGKKMIDETLAKIYQEKGLEVRIARIFNSYGERLIDNRAVPSIIKSILKDEPIKVHGDGGHVRCYCYVSDTIDGIISLMESNVNYPINIGNNSEPISFLNLVKLIGKIIDRKYKLKFVEDLPNNIRVRIPDLSRSKLYLNYNPKVSLYDGLKRTIEFFVNGGIK